MFHQTTNVLMWTRQSSYTNDKRTVNSKWETVNVFELIKSRRAVRYTHSQYKLYWCYTSCLSATELRFCVAHHQYCCHCSTALAAVLLTVGTVGCSIILYNSIPITWPGTDDSVLLIANIRSESVNKCHVSAKTVCDDHN